MKKYLVVLSVILSVFAVANFAHAGDFKPVVKVQLPENAFAPMGFDDNDNAQIVLFGNLPDTCHKAGAVRVRVDRERKTIFIRNEVLFYQGCWCADVLTPYIQTVNLGVLPAGVYSVAIEAPNGSLQRMARLPVSIAMTASPDEHLYAPVEQVQFNGGHDYTSPEAVISGTIRNSCMVLTDIKVNYRLNHVIEFLPIVEMKGENCAPELRPFSAKVKISEAYRGRTLLHVRSLNGQALNQVVEL